MTVGLPCSRQRGGYFTYVFIASARPFTPRHICRLSGPSGTRVNAISDRSSHGTIEYSGLQRRVGELLPRLRTSRVGIYPGSDVPRAGIEEIAARRDTLDLNDQRACASGWHPTLRWTSCSDLISGLSLRRDAGIYE